MPGAKKKGGRLGKGAGRWFQAYGKSGQCGRWAWRHRAYPAGLGNTRRLRETKKEASSFGLPTPLHGNSCELFLGA